MSNFTMALNGPSLFELMTMLPALHPRNLLQESLVTLKQLRLVSKDIGFAAQTAVTSCEVNLGEGAPSPNAQQMSKLVAGAQLQGLHIIMHVSTSE